MSITLDRIMAVNAAYIRCIDTGVLESWPDFFLDDCLYKVTTAENHKAGLAAGVIYADSKAMLSDRILALRQANVYEKQNYRHIVGLPNVIKNGGDTAECETPFIVVRIMHDGQTDVFATGVYLDTLRDTDGELKFAQRMVVCDSSRFDTLVALPL
ncbi:MAG: nuclear transport factor 2 family protein [Pseudomonadota bacterium]